MGICRRVLFDVILFTVGIGNPNVIAVHEEQKASRQDTLFVAGKGRDDLVIQAFRVVMCAGVGASPSGTTRYRIAPRSLPKASPDTDRTVMKNFAIIPPAIQSACGLFRRASLKRRTICQQYTLHVRAL